MISGMEELPGTQLCKACGLCCTGHLFAWVKLRPRELAPSARVGLKVFTEEPTERGFAQPCPLWQQGSCSIYDRPEYPRACRSFNCKLLKQVLAGEQPLYAALEAVTQAQAQFARLEEQLGREAGFSFRDRFVALLEGDQLDEALHTEAQALLHVYEQVFGVMDLLEK